MSRLSDLFWNTGNGVISFMSDTPKVYGEYALELFNTIIQSSIENGKSVTILVDIHDELGWADTPTFHMGISREEEKGNV